MSKVVARGSRQAEGVPFKKIASIVGIICAVLVFFGLVSNISKASKYVKNHTHHEYCYEYFYRDDFYTDLENGKLQKSKMDCEYAKGAFGMGLSNYFEGGIFLPLLVAVGGFGYAYVMRERAKSYEVTVTEEAIKVSYSDGKELIIPICSVFSIEIVGASDLSIVTSENAYRLREMEGVVEVHDAITKLLPEISFKSPTNNEQVLAKGYPPAIKPVLMVLLVLVALAAVITAIAAEAFAVVLIGAVPFAILLVLYLLAKTPYIVVTDKRVFYVSDFGRKLSLPMNKITVTVTHWWFKQLHIAAPAGRIHLFWVKNTAELYDVINAVQNEKQ